MNDDAHHNSNSNTEATDDARPVDRCVCFDQTFESILQWCSANDAMTLDAIRDRFGCGRGCGLCVPYLKQMLQTGQTRFPITNDDDSHGVSKS